MDHTQQESEKLDEVVAFIQRPEIRFESDHSGVISGWC